MKIGLALSNQNQREFLAASSRKRLAESQSGAIGDWRS
jgi:hypothetical protein